MYVCMYVYNTYIYIIYIYMNMAIIYIYESQIKYWL